MNLLEQIIRKTLFERRMVAKIRNATKQITADGRAFGAVHTYSVLVKGTSNPKEILNQVYSVTVSDAGSDTATIKNVGEYSTYATDKYVYVCSNPENKDRQLINVWIVPMSVIDTLTKTKKSEPLRGFHEIGKAQMLDKFQLANYYELEGKLNKLKGEYINIIDPNPSDKEIEDLEKAEAEYYKLHPEERPKDDKKIDDKKIDDKTVDDKKIDDKTVDDIDQIRTYPFKWDTNNGEFTVYTVGPTDAYVYWIQDNIWQTIKKSKFETSSNITGLPISKPAVIASLNKTFNQNVTATSEKVKPETPIETKTPAGNSNKNKVIQLNTAKKNARDKLQFHEIKLNKTDVYEYKNGKFNKIGNYDPKTSQQIRYLGSSSDFKYVQVQFMKDNMKAWILTSAVK